MGNTKIISLRIPLGLLRKIDDIAWKHKRSRAFVMIEMLGGTREDFPDGIPIDVAQESIHSDLISQSKCHNKDHVGFRRSDGYWCVNCVKLY